MLRPNPFTPQTIAAGTIAAIVGFASSFAILLKGFAAVGATPEQAASGLMAAAIAMGLAGIVMSLRTKMPVSSAWSTPGAALLIISGAGFTFDVAVGAFIVCALMLMVAGLWKPLGLAVAAIPQPLANAMLAGVLLALCLAPVKAVAQVPLLALPVVLVWAVMLRVKRLYAVPVAVAVALAIMIVTAPPLASTLAFAPHPVLIVPRFSLSAIVGIALPLFIVTMASQNVPGVAVLAVNGYTPPPGPLFFITGLWSLLAAPFGGHAVNLAAITAAICAGPEAGPDPARRYGAAIVAGTLYVLFGLGAGAVTAIVASASPQLVETAAGLALLGALSTSLAGAVANPDMREAAAITFVVSASGITIAGIGAPFWGLLAGGGFVWLMRARR